jgi:AcrR family transcriptional regulator
MSRQRDDRDAFGVLWEDPEPAEHRSRGRGRARRDRDAGLSRDLIVRTALELADEHGHEAVSMRRLAAELGVGTMSLYHYVPTRDDLLDLMHDDVMGELLVPADELGQGWRDGLAAISRRTRDVWLRHPWLVSNAGERPHLGPRAFAHVEQSLGVVAGLGLSPEEQNVMLDAADSYVLGFAIRQVASTQAMARRGQEPAEYLAELRPHLERLITERADDFPHLAQLRDAPWDVDPEVRFERGLGWMLDGLEAWLAKRGRG